LSAIRVVRSQQATTTRKITIIHRRGFHCDNKVTVGRTMRA
jgi:hypothetical protein